MYSGDELLEARGGFQFVNCNAPILECQRFVIGETEIDHLTALSQGVLTIRFHERPEIVDGIYLPHNIITRDKPF